MKLFLLVNRNKGVDDECYSKLQETLKNKEQYNCLKYESIIIIEKEDRKDKTSSPVDIKIPESFSIPIVAVGFYDYKKNAPNSTWCDNSLQVSTNLQDKLEDGLLTSIIFDSLDGILVGDNRDKLFEVSCDSSCTR